MNWKGRRQSKNVEDARDLPIPKDDIGELIKEIDKRDMPTPTANSTKKQDRPKKDAKFFLK